VDSLEAGMLPERSRAPAQAAGGARGAPMPS
jgi:hypothetical protein